MKRQHLSLLGALLIIGSACQALAPAPTPIATATQTATPPTAAAEWPDWDDRDAFRSNLLPSQQGILNEMPDAAIYRLDLNIDPDLVHIAGKESVRYFNRAGVALDELQFHLFPNILGGGLTISSARVNGEATSFSYARSESVLRVPFSAPLQPEESVIVDLEFSAAVPIELSRNYGIMASTEGVLALAHIYPQIAVYDEASGWATDIPSEQGDVTYAEASFYHVRIHAPQDLVLVASGSEVARSAQGDQQVVTYAAGPARDFYLAASGDYTLTSRDTGSYIINSYAPPEMQDGSEMALRVAADALDFFSAQYAPYPYAEFDIVATPTYALGIEYPGMTAVNVDIYDLSANFGGAPAAEYLESTIAHEVGHQWFYNMVGNDQLDEPWLDESLTQYITWQYYRHVYGAADAAEFERSLRGRWQREGLREMPIGLPVDAYQDGEYSAIIYGRGGLFFEALAQEMGADNFDAFLSEYVTSYRWKVAATEDIKDVAEEYCTCDLTPLFTAWVFPRE